MDHAMVTAASLHEGIFEGAKQKIPLLRVDRGADSS